MTRRGRRRGSGRLRRPGVPRRGVRRGVQVAVLPVVVAEVVAARGVKVELAGGSQVQTDGICLRR